MNSNNEDPTNGKLTPYEWQRAISASNLDPVTRGVLWALSLYINKSTGCAFPSLRTLSSASGYSLDAVRRHIKIALNSGWIEINNAALEGQGWRRNAYIPMIPEGMPRRLKTKRKHKRVLPVSIPSQEGVLSISTPLTQEGVLPQPQGVLPQPLNTAPENAPEPAPTVAFSDSPAAPNNILTMKERERGECFPLTPSHSLSVSSNSPQEGETSKVGGNVEAATIPGSGGNPRLGCQDPAVEAETGAKGKKKLEAFTHAGAHREVVHEVHQTAGESPEAAAKRDPCLSDPIPKAAIKANGKPTTGRKRQRQGNGVAQPSPVPWPLSDDDIKAVMRETGWSEAKVKDEAPKFRDYHSSKGTLSCDWLAEWRLWKRRGDEWESRERERTRANGKVERIAPRPPVFIAEPKTPIDPSKPRPNLKAMCLEEIARQERARRAAQP
jgi:hypothetical protein